MADLPKGYIALAISSGDNLRRWILFLSTAVLLILGCLWVLFRFILAGGENVELSFSPEGASIVITADQRKKAQFLLPASSGWTNTGIKIPANTSFDFTASGRSYLSIRQLVEAANKDTMPKYPWSGPKGTDFVGNKMRGAAMKQLLILSESNIGALLGCFQKAGDPTPGLSNMRPQGRFEIGRGIEDKKSPAVESTLWLTVNDIYLDPKQLDLSKLAYVGSDTTSERTRRWNYIQKHGHWDLWFQDNMGHYLVQLVEQK